MDIRLFGPLTIEDGPRRLGPADLGGRKPKQILEILLTERGHVVSKNRIADLLWPEGGPENPAATIDTYVSVLRRHLEPSAARAKDCRYVRSVHPGYLFDTSDAEIDVERFERLVDEARKPATLGIWKRLIAPTPRQLTSIGVSTSRTSHTPPGQTSHAVTSSAPTSSC